MPEQSTMMKPEITVKPQDDSFKFLHEIFAKAAKTHPGRPAIRMGRHIELSYQEVNEKANQLAHQLIADGVKPGERVAVLLDKSPQQYIAQLAIMKIGGVFVPVNAPEELGNDEEGRPQWRGEDNLKHRFELAKPSAIITQGDKYNKVLDHVYRRGQKVKHQGLTQISLDNPVTVKKISEQSIDNPDRCLEPKENPDAYVYFTSGSTGKPKGVLLGHEGLPSRLKELQKQMRLSPEDVVGQIGPPDADVNFWNSMIALSAGACIDLVPAEYNTIASLPDYCNQQGVTYLTMVPSFHQSLDPAGFKTLKYLTTTGEDVKMESLDRWKKEAPELIRIFNAMGPTETTIDLSVAVLYDRDQGIELDTVHIGQPLEGVVICCYDVTTGGYFLPQEHPGREGELLIGGIGVGKGYLDNPSETAKKFVDVPRGQLTFLSDHDSLPEHVHFYRSGDKVTFNADGNMVFLGRIDNLKIKPNGIYTDPNGIKKNIEDFILTLPENTLQLSSFKQTEKGLEVKLKVLPGNTSSNIQRDLHKYLQRQSTRRIKLSITLDKPTAWKTSENSCEVDEKIDLTEPEKNVIDILLSILDSLDIKRRDDTSIDDFITDELSDLIADSLKIIQFKNRLLNTDYRSLNLKDPIFLNPEATLLDLARYIIVQQNPDKRTQPVHKAKQKPGEPEKPPLFMIHSAIADGGEYHRLFSGKNNFPADVYAIAAEGLINPNATPDELDAMAVQYIRDIKHRQKKGPYRISGYSLGGILAYIIAQKLRAKDEEASVIMLDSPCPEFLQQLTSEQHAVNMHNIARSLFTHYFKRPETDLPTHIVTLIESDQFSHFDKIEQINSVIDAFIQLIANDKLDPALRSQCRITKPEFQPQVENTENSLELVRKFAIAALLHPAGEPLQDVTVVRASDQFIPDINHQLGWHTSQEDPAMKVIEVPGTHFSFIQQDEEVCGILENWLSQQSVQSSINAIKQCYQRQPGVSFLLEQGRTFPLADVFVQLELKNKPSTECQDDKISRDPTESKAITSEDIFQAHGDQPENDRVLVEGCAGSGKTTLCASWLHDWAQSGQEALWQDSELVLHFPVREICQYQHYPRKQGDGPKSYNWQEVLRGNWNQFDIYKKSRGRKGCSDFSLEEKEQLIQWIEANPNKVTFVIDGLDEMQTKHLAVEALYNFDGRVVATTRPGIKPDAFEEARIIENKGFNDENREKYIHQYFDMMGAPDKAETLIAWIQANRQLKDSLLIPINCQLLCSAWQHNEDELGEQPTVTRLYQIFMMQWQKRSLIKADADLKTMSTADIEAETAVCMDVLEQLAFRAVQTNGGTFIKGAWLEEAIILALQNHGIATPLIADKKPVLEQLLRFGILVRQKTSDNDYAGTYTPAHLTFIEFLAARKMAWDICQNEDKEEYQTTLSQFKEFIISWLLNTVEIGESGNSVRHQERLWHFVAGLIPQFNPEKFIDFINIVLSTDRGSAFFKPIDFALSLWESSDPQPLYARAKKPHYDEVMQLQGEVVTSDDFDETIDDKMFTYFLSRINIRTVLRSSRITSHRLFTDAVLTEFLLKKVKDVPVPKFDIALLPSKFDSCLISFANNPGIPPYTKNRLIEKISERRRKLSPTMRSFLVDHMVTDFQFSFPKNDPVTFYIPVVQTFTVQRALHTFNDYVDAFQRCLEVSTSYRETLYPELCACIGYEIRVAEEVSDKDLEKLFATLCKIEDDSVLLEFSRIIKPITRRDDWGTKLSHKLLPWLSHPETSKHARNMILDTINEIKHWDQKTTEALCHFILSLEDRHPLRYKILHKILMRPSLPQEIIAIAVELIEKSDNPSKYKLLFQILLHSLLPQAILTLAVQFIEDESIDEVDRLDMAHQLAKRNDLAPKQHQSCFNIAFKRLKQFQADIKKHQENLEQHKLNVQHHQGMLAHQEVEDDNESLVPLAEETQELLQEQHKEDQPSEERKSLKKAVRQLTEEENLKNRLYSKTLGILARKTHQVEDYMAIMKDLSADSITRIRIAKEIARQPEVPLAEVRVLFSLLRDETINIHLREKLAYTLPKKIQSLDRVWYHDFYNLARDKSINVFIRIALIKALSEENLLPPCVYADMAKLTSDDTDDAYFRGLCAEYLSTRKDLSESLREELVICTLDHLPNTWIAPNDDIETPLDLDNDPYFIQISKDLQTDMGVKGISLDFYKEYMRPKYKGAEHHQWGDITFNPKPAKSMFQNSRKSKTHAVVIHNLFKETSLSEKITFCVNAGFDETQCKKIFLCFDDFTLQEAFDAYFDFPEIATLIYDHLILEMINRMNSYNPEKILDSLKWFIKANGALAYASAINVMQEVPAFFREPILNHVQPFIDYFNSTGGSELFCTTTDEAKKISEDHKASIESKQKEQKLTAQWSAGLFGQTECVETQPQAISHTRPAAPESSDKPETPPISSTIQVLDEKCETYARPPARSLQESARMHGIFFHPAGPFGPTCRQQERDDQPDLLTSLVQPCI